MTLGQTLKYYRDEKMFTLRQVEEAIGVSNAYLSQLENDKIKMPSANVLYKLASLYVIDLGILLISAGIVDKKNWKPITLQEKLTEDEEAQLLRYLEFLRFEKHKKNNPKTT